MSRRPIGLSDIEAVLEDLLTDGDEVVSFTCHPPFTPGRVLVLIMSEAGSILWP
jgi:hypothetical protein